MSGHPYNQQHPVYPYLQTHNHSQPQGQGYYAHANVDASGRPLTLDHSSQPPLVTSTHSIASTPGSAYNYNGQPRQVYAPAAGTYSAIEGYTGQGQQQGYYPYQGVGAVPTQGYPYTQSATPYPHAQAYGYPATPSAQHPQQHLSPSPVPPGQVQSPYTSLGQTLSPDPATYHQPLQQLYTQPQPQPQQQQHQQQQQQELSQPTSIEPSFFRSSTSPLSTFGATSHPAGYTGTSAPSPPNSGAASPSKVPKIKLRLPASASDTASESSIPLAHTDTLNGTNEMPPRSSRGHVEHEIRSRPSRQAASVAVMQTRAHLEDDSEGDYEEDQRPTRGGRRVSGANQYVKAESAEIDDGTRRSVRDRKAPQRFGGEDEFEERLMETSPVAPSPKVRLTMSRGKKGRKVVDPDEDDYYDEAPASQDVGLEDAEGEAETEEETPVKPRRAFPPAAANPDRRLSASHPINTVSNGRPVRSSAKRNRNNYGNESDQNSFQPSHSDGGSGGGTESDDVLGQSIGGTSDETATSDDDAGSYGRRSKRRPRAHKARRKASAPTRNTRNSGSAGTRRSARNKVPGSEEDDDEEWGGISRGGGRGAGGRRNLRERKSQVNYALPPVDISMELAQAQQDLNNRVNGRGSFGAAGVGALTGLGARGKSTGARARGLVAGARFGGGGGFAGLGGLGGRDMARAMGDVDSSDSVVAMVVTRSEGRKIPDGGAEDKLQPVIATRVSEQSVIEELASRIGALSIVPIHHPYPYTLPSLLLSSSTHSKTDIQDLDILSGPKPGSGAAANTSNAGGMGMAGAGGAAPAGGAGKIGAPTDVANFGRVNPKSSMADADPLGVDMNVTFDNVGGLDDHINQLKEMVALPLLYPEVFQQFGITPPRGVLFHGPPGTGKTLLARALAASCSTGNTKIAFFMRKGADVLSKWVGEAERQLRMLFEEARAAQPSIIFFDEIDGLAPVRSSKQDQIHASLVSTLLALMDGMDGRGQVIVIGATNRPDSVDPALRRPGRFDREFYFPLPNKEARKKIIRINTRKWTPQLDDGMVERLAGLTKGYGGADMRALCTEAALNAIQRRYPQIYKSTDRYELDTTSIEVKAKDFMMSIKKIVPSSARSTSSTAIPLPAHLVPLLSPPLERIKSKVDDVLPRHKQKTALEEAMFEDDEAELNEEGAVLVQYKMRTYRPRLLISGPAGMGQAYLGPAILHHLEGFHVQNLDLGVLLGDSGRTPEAALVQLFIEAKRHQPSIIYVPNLSAWSATLSDSARATFKSLLDGIQPSEPVLLLGVVEEEEISAEVRGWFGWGGEGDVELATPSESERTEYFLPLLTHLQTPPTSWPDALPRRPRVLEQLALAAPLPERQRSQAEIEAEHERDKSAMNMMVLSFTGLLSDWAKRYKRLVLQLKEDVFALHQVLVETSLQAQPAPAPPVDMVNGDGADIPSISLQPPTQQVAEGEPANMVIDDTYGAVPDSSAIDPPIPTESVSAPAPAPLGPDWTPYDLDLDKMQLKLIKFKYHRPRDFLDDVDRIAANAEHLGDLDKLNKVAEMTAHAYLHVSEFEPKWMPEFDAFAERMKRRKEERRAQKVKEKEQVVNGDGEEQGTLKRAREGEDVDMEDREDVKRARSTEPSQVGDTTADAATVPPPMPFTAPIPASPPPTPVYPPFIIPVEPLAELTRSLRVNTASFSIEQLEQLRAAVFDRIWKKRALWDRTELVRELQGVLEGFVRNVERVQGARA